MLLYLLKYLLYFGCVSCCRIAGERPFKCDYPKCNWSFASNADLKVHMKSHGVTDPKQHLLSTSDNRL